MLQVYHFGTLVEYSSHHFAVSANMAMDKYSSYINGRIHCSLKIGEACVAPLKVMTISIMELIAAILSVKMSILLKKEFEILVDKEVFCTDSEVTLRYIREESKRFKIFVANKL